MEPKKAQSQEERRQRLAVLRSRRQSRLASTVRDTYLTSHRASLDKERDRTQSRLNIMTRILGPQYRQGPHGLEPSSAIDLAACVPGYITSLRVTGRLPPIHPQLADGLAWRAAEGREQVQSLNPNLVNPYLVNQELAELYAYGSGKGVAARTGMVIQTMPPPPPPERSPVLGGQVPKNSIYQKWDVVEWDAAVECAKFVAGMRGQRPRDPEAERLELEEIRKLEAEQASEALGERLELDERRMLEVALASEELERRDSPLEGPEGSVGNPICLDVETITSSLFDNAARL